MRSSEFEESEYEAPLYVQLQYASVNVWSPGQVLEAHVGFDHALFTMHPHFWRLQGFAAPPSGVILGAYPPHHWWKDRQLKRPLPDFSLNLFIQAKRPLVGSRTTKALKSMGIAGPYWKFIVSKNQQLVLESLAKSTLGDALVCYACAAFDRVSELWAHSRAGSIVAASTFPAANSLHNHDAWYYTTPGCSGVANPTPEKIEDVPLLEQISRLASQRTDGQRRDSSVDRNLKQLAAAVYESLSEEAVGNSGRTAAYFESLREIDQYIDFVRPRRYADAVRNYLAVAMFARIFGLHWHTIAT